MRKVLSIAVIVLVSGVCAWGQSAGGGGTGNNGASAGAEAARGAQGGGAQGGENPQARRQGAGGDVNQAFQQSGGSLFAMQNGGGQGGGSAGGPATNQNSSLFAVAPREPRKLQKWDLITVIVREESDSKSKSLTDLKKSADFNALLEQYVQFSLSNFALKGQPALANQPQLKAQAQRNFKGDGAADRSDSMSARVQAQVIDVKPNGLLIVQATKQIKVDDEEQKFTLTGMVRAEDVTPDNSVLSTQLADLSLEKTTNGAVRDTSKRGWIPKLIDSLNPF